MDGDKEPEGTAAGYRSQAAKRWFMLAVILAVGATLVLTGAAPLLLARVLLPGTEGDLTVTMALARADTATLWQGATWYVSSAVASEFSFGGGAPVTKNTLVRLTAAGTEEQFVLSDGDSWLVPQGEALWIVSRDGVTAYDGKKMTPLVVRSPAGRMWRPFRLGGRPAVPVEKDGVCTVYVLEDTAWRATATFRTAPDDAPAGSPGPGRTRVAALGDTPVVFRRKDGVLFSHTGFPAGKQPFPEGWQRVAAVRSAWDAAVVDGALTVVHDETASRGLDTLLVERVHTASGWQRRAETSIGLPARTLGLTADASGGAIAFVQSVPYFLHRVSLAGGKATGGSVVMTVPRAGRTVAVIALVKLLPGAFLVLLVLALTRLVRTYRTPSFRPYDADVFYAPLLRRFAARLVDTAIMLLPFLIGAACILIFLWRYAGSNLHGLATGMAVVSGLALAGVFWVVFLLMVFSWSEGKWGKTPGKRLLGITVMGAELRPCRFGRALVRNLLLLLDLFFSGTVGLLLIALTLKWQRLGDLAANTIVIRDSLPREPERE